MIERLMTMRLLSTMLLMLLAAAAPGFDFVRDGRATATILLPDDPHLSETRAPNLQRALFYDTSVFGDLYFNLIPGDRDE